MNLPVRAGIFALLPLILAACHLVPRERDWTLGSTCKDGRCYDVVAKVEFREKSYFEPGHSSEEVLGNRIAVTEIDRSTGKSRQYPELVCNDVSCIDYGLNLIVCDGKVLTKDGRENFTVEGLSAATLKCTDPVYLGRFPLSHI